MNIINYQPKNSRVLASAPVARLGHACAYLNGKIYMFGGSDATTIYNTIYEYNISTNSWSLITPTGASFTGGSYCGIWVYNNEIYVFGGKSAVSGAGAANATLYKYNPSTNVGTALASNTGQGRFGGTYSLLTAPDGVKYLYYFAGYIANDQSTISTAIYRYNPSTNAWSSAGTVPSSFTSRDGTTTVTNQGMLALSPHFTYNNKHYILAYGFSYVLTPGLITTTSTTVTRNFTDIDDGNTAIVVGSKAYLHGNRIPGQSAESWIFDLQSQNYAKINNFTYNSARHFLVTDGTKIYAISMTNPEETGLDTRVIEYTPEDNTGVLSYTDSVTVNDFSLGTSFAANGWTVVNSATVNKWRVGAFGGSGTSGNSAYIATTAGGSKGYDINLQAVSHFYRDITIPNDSCAYKLKFYVNVNGEIFGSTYADYLSVFITDTTFSVTSDVVPANINSQILVFSNYLFATDVTFDVTGFKGKTIRLLFIWENDSSAGSGVGVAIDNVRLERYNYVPLTQTLISDFSLGNDFATNGWTVVNGAQTNKWFVGTLGGTGTSGNSAYISGDNGVTKGYVVSGATSVVHFYRDIAIPNTANNYKIKLFTTERGEVTGSTQYDFMTIRITTTATTPVAGTQLATGTQIFKESFFGSTTTDVDGFTFDVTSYKGTTIRLVFTWVNDGTTGNATGGASVDDVYLLSY